ncbi:anhydro-N-acetylmuramic acid kinase [Alteromonas facilis]|uniref:anhydro-N-acetylmuramic acid kinase n=1 Tax=Alteromonas facilis TaxID=2048004 RepID=UPI000C28DC78|nr:anhydro-N-acetylmuramic acid kinase [Alteromonas facilis]
MPETPQYFIGLMSGTSMDGVDAVIANIENHNLSLLAHCHVPYSNETLSLLRELSVPGTNEIDKLGAADNQVADHFSKAVNACLEKSGLRAADIVAIGSHGQTIRHRPEGVLGLPSSEFTLQVGDANRIAVKTQIPVVADFRRKDIALGGQGAPLAPAFHNEFFNQSNKQQIVLNLGGIANITLLPSSTSSAIPGGYDTGPANVLMDGWIQQHLNKPYDDQGTWACSGKVVVQLLQRMLDDEYFSRNAPKSTGIEYFNLAWLSSYLGTMDIPPEDVQATLCALTVETVAREVESIGDIEEIFVCGGGAFNTHFLTSLKRRLAGIQIDSTLAHGIHPMHVEALAFAWLAKQYWYKLPGNIPAVTGAKRAAVLGALYLPD